MMKKLKMYQITTGVLLLLNLGLLALLLISPKGGGRPGGRALKDLDMTKEQHNLFQASADAHQQQMKNINQRQYELMEDYLLTLPDENAPATKPPPPEVIRLEEEKISSTYEHLFKVKGLLKPEQLDKYPDFVENATRHILGKGQKKRLPPKEKE